MGEVIDLGLVISGEVENSGFLFVVLCA